VQIKRRENQCSTVSRVWLESSESSSAAASADHTTANAQSLSLSPDTRGAETPGFLVYVETKGGLTHGRQKQRYVLLKRNALYVLSCPAAVSGCTEPVSVVLRTRSGEVMALGHWHPNEPAPPTPSSTGSSNSSSGQNTPTSNKTAAAAKASLKV
jgi:hypothetical protein